MIQGPLACAEGRGQSDSAAAAVVVGAPRTLRAAQAQLPDASVALISVPGDFAAAEALKAIRRGLDVMIFSDNVPLEDEVTLKREARAKLPAQAAALDRMLREERKPLQRVVLMDVDAAVLTRRIAGRRSCPACGSVYNIYSMPSEAGDRCQNCPDHPALFQRPDDNEATVANRLKVYEEQTRPLVDYYRRQGLLRSVDAEGDVDAITAKLDRLCGDRELRHRLGHAARERARHEFAWSHAVKTYLALCEKPA